MLVTWCSLTALDHHSRATLLDDRSSLVESILVSAQQTKRGSFRVIIVDSRPGVEGRQLADILSAEGIPCTYVLLTAISYMMRVSTVYLLCRLPLVWFYLLSKGDFPIERSTQESKRRS